MVRRSTPASCLLTPLSLRGLLLLCPVPLAQNLLDLLLTLLPVAVFLLRINAPGRQPNRLPFDRARQHPRLAGLGVQENRGRAGRRDGKLPALRCGGLRAWTFLLCESPTAQSEQPHDEDTDHLTTGHG